jgi:hypothetical protein
MGYSYFQKAYDKPLEEMEKLSGSAVDIDKPG